MNFNQTAQLTNILHEYACPDFTTLIQLNTYQFTSIIKLTIKSTTTQSTLTKFNNSMKIAQFFLPWTNFNFTMQHQIKSNILLR